MRRRIIGRMYGVISSGKEARVYWAKSPKGEDLAVKIYLTSTSEFRKSIYQYILGDPRFEYVRKDTRELIYAWTRKEYKNLKRMYEYGVRVPKPIFYMKNILVMEFIGENGIRAPLLKEVSLSDEEYIKIFNKVIEYIKILYRKAKLVHADLSEYNIMIFKGEPVLIDVSQAVLLDHPLAIEFLKRDIRNIVRYFRDELGLHVPSEEEIFKLVTSE